MASISRTKWLLQCANRRIAGHLCDQVEFIVTIAVFRPNGRKREPPRSRVTRTYHNES